jgi:hypothetical protein
MPFDAQITYFLAIGGLTVAFWDIVRMWFSLDSKQEKGNTPEIDVELLKGLRAYLTTNSRDTVLKDYESCQAEVGRRDNSTLLIGSIFTTASLLIIANTISQTNEGWTFTYAFASIMLFLLWLLIVHRTSNEEDRITYKRIHTIERALTTENSEYHFGLHQQVWRETHTSEGRTLRWLKIRRTFWDDILMLISLSWLLLSLASLWVQTSICVVELSMSLVFLSIWSYYWYITYRQVRVS